MRQLSFRLWNGERMEPVGEIVFHTDGSFNVNGEYPVNDTHMEEKFGGNKYFLMQYAGLKIGGTEVYEGDVIKDKNIDWEVFWGDKFGWTVRAMHAYGNTSNHRIYRKLDWISQRKNVAIIGNIYENPNLKQEMRYMKNPSLLNEEEYDPKRYI